MNRVIGLSGIAYAILDESTGKYGDIKMFKGAKSLSTSTELAESKFYSDNTVDFISQKISSIGIELEMAYVDAQIEADILGKTILDNGAVVDTSDSSSPTICLLAEYKTLEKPIRKIWHKCKLSKDGESVATQEDGVEEKMLPKFKGICIAGADGSFGLTFDANNVPTGKEEAFNQSFNNFYTAIQLPDGTEQTPEAKSKIK